jgi:hypothetical protein
MKKRMYYGIFRFHDRCKNLEIIFSFAELEKKNSFEGTAVNIHNYFYLSCIKIKLFGISNFVLNNELCF